jgi:CheY-like chemotaxis protein
VGCSRPQGNLCYAGWMTDPTSSPKQRILVIEDDPVAQKVVTDYLASRGYHVHWARNGADGIEMAKILSPDLVLCDVLLPRKSGYEVCFELKRPTGAPAEKRVPVILMSAHLASSGDQSYAKEGVHADAFLAKPFAMSAMLQRIQELLPSAPSS